MTIFNEQFGKKFKRIRERKRFSLNQAARQAGLSSSTLSRIENGQRNIPKPETLKKLARGLRISEDEMFKLAGLRDDIPDEAIPYNEDDMVELPILGEIACGEPILADENLDGTLSTSKKGLPNGENFWLKCRGDSMLPKIPDGAYVLIHGQPEVENNQIAAVRLDDDSKVTLKRIQYQGNQVLLIPENRDFSPIILNQDNPGRILGKAIRMRVDF